MRHKEQESDVDACDCEGCYAHTDINDFMHLRSDDSWKTVRGELLSAWAHEETSGGDAWFVPARLVMQMVEEIEDLKSTLATLTLQHKAKGRA